MTIKWFDRVRDTGTTTGTGNFTVTGTPPSTYRTLNDVYSTNDELIYSIAHRSANEFEVGVGVYAGSHAFSRPRILSSSNAGSAVSFSAGTKDVFTVLPANYGIRESLTADRTYYVRTDGSDSNNGLADTAAGAFLTIQAAYNQVIRTLDFAGFTVTIQVRDGTYAAGITTTVPPSGRLIIQGNVTTRANVLVSTGGSDAFNFDMLYFGSRVVIKSLKITTSSGSAIYGVSAANLGVNDVDFGACPAPGVHINMRAGSKCTIEGNYVITGGADVHYYLLGQSFIGAIVPTVTITGTPAFSTFSYCQGQSQLSVYNGTYTGSATGTRFAVGSQGYINTFGGGVNYFPGSVAGGADSTAFGLYQ